MKKLLIGFLAVGLIMSFAMTASAQPNIKASGQLYMLGAYSDNQKVINDGPSRANIANRMRIQFEIQMQEGLKLTTRFDALERAWGEQQRSTRTHPRHLCLDRRSSRHDRAQHLLGARLCDLQRALRRV